MFTDISVEYVDHMGSDLNVVNAARVSFAKECSEWDGLEFTAKQNTGLLKYLAKHGHWSPFAHTCISVRAKVPIFLARQLVKHQVGGNWNEESRRYIDTPVEFYRPEHLHTRPDNAKQGAGGIHQQTPWYNHLIQRHSVKSHKLYTNLILNQVAPEEARMVLPLNTMTNLVWTGSLLFFDRVIQQRLDPHAQLVAQEFAAKLRDVVHPLYPESYSALAAVWFGEDVGGL